MRIRLVQPPLIQPRYRQLTLPVVGAELAAAGFEVEANDENVEELDLSPVDFVGITAHVYNAPRAFELARAFRERGCRVIMGGTFPTVAPELVAPHCDSVVVGELEGLAPRIAADARAGTLRPVYRADAPPSLQSTVRPDLSLTPRDRYFRFNFPLELSRGCRFSCRFCTARTLYPTPRTRSLADIERDLAQYDHGLVELLDVNFLNDPPFFERVLPLLRGARIPGWTGQATVADLAADPGLPERLAESRCRAVFVGLETLEEEGLRSIDKGWSRPGVFLDVARRLREAGVLVQVGIVVGLDSDTPESFARMGDFLDEARVHTLTASWLHYYPGTAQWEELRRAGRLLGTDLRDLDGNHLVVKPARMEPDALKREVSKLLRRFYGFDSIGRRMLHRGMAKAPSQLWHHLFQNAVMRVYYQMVEAAAGDDAAARYMGGARRDDRLEKAAADGSAWLLDRVFG